MTTEKIDAILNSVSQRVKKLIPSGRFYVVLYDPKKSELSFPLVRKDDEIVSWDSRSFSRENMLPDLVIREGKSLLYEKDLLSRFEKEHIRYWPEGEIPQSWLGVHMGVGEEVVSVLVIESWQKSYSFSKNDEAILTTVARQTAIAIENVRLYEQLERKIENLRILNETGQQLTRGLVKQENEILELIYKSANNLNIDTRNMYITFYEPDSTKPDTADEIHGTLRFPLAFENGQRVVMEDRAARKGLTEYVIRTKELFNPADVQTTSRELAPDSNWSRRSRSWLGVPILSEEQVFGVIVLRNSEFEQAYTQDDQEIFGILAGQAAIALQNLRLYQSIHQEQEKRMAAENMMVIGVVAAEFAHKMNNLAGTIPVRISIAKSQLDNNNVKDAKVIEQLTSIENEANGLLRAAKEIRESTEPKAIEDIDVNELLGIAIIRAKNAQSNRQNHVEFRREFADNLPFIRAERNSFIDTLTSIIKNGVEAIDGQGLVTITTHRANLSRKDVVEIEVSDTGRGIAPSEISKIFELFYTTKGEKGLGFGLWRDRIFIKRLGGELGVQSEVGKGSTFTVRIPIDKNT
jgi:signal transduction histidine kinase